jgi:hypothetical protein
MMHVEGKVNRFIAHGIPFATPKCWKFLDRITVMGLSIRSGQGCLVCTVRGFFVKRSKVGIAVKSNDEIRTLVRAAMHMLNYLLKKELSW